MQISWDFSLRYQCLQLSIFACVSRTSLVQFNKWEVVRGMRLTQISWNRFYHSPILASWIESILLILVAELARQPLPPRKGSHQSAGKISREDMLTFSENDAFCAGQVSKCIEERVVCTLKSILFSALTLTLRIFSVQFIIKLLLIFKRNEDYSSILGRCITESSIWSRAILSIIV